MKPTIETLRAALITMHKRACGDLSRLYMSVPARPDVDADLLLMAALDELEQLRADLARVRREALEEAAAEALRPGGLRWWSSDCAREISDRILALASTPDAETKP